MARREPEACWDSREKDHRLTSWWDFGKRDNTRSFRLWNGMHLEASAHDDSGEEQGRIIIKVIKPYRDDPEGIPFDGEILGASDHGYSEWHELTQKQEKVLTFHLCNSSLCECRYEDSQNVKGKKPKYVVIHIDRCRALPANRAKEKIRDWRKYTDKSKNVKDFRSEASAEPPRAHELARPVRGVGSRREVEPGHPPHTPAGARVREKGPGPSRDKSEDIGGEDVEVHTPSDEDGAGFPPLKGSKLKTPRRGEGHQRDALDAELCALKSRDQMEQSNRDRLATDDDYRVTLELLREGAGGPRAAHGQTLSAELLRRC